MLSQRPQQENTCGLTWLLSELKSGCGDRLHFVPLDGDVSLHQLVFLEQVLDLQQVLPELGRQEVSLAKRTNKVEGARRGEDTHMLGEDPSEGSVRGVLRPG